jgi:hypothetical protein
MRSLAPPPKSLCSRQDRETSLLDGVYKICLAILCTCYYCWLIMIILKLVVEFFLQKMLDWWWLVPWMEFVTFLILSSVFFHFFLVFCIFHFCQCVFYNFIIFPIFSVLIKPTYCPLYWCMFKQDICNLVKLPLIDIYHYSLQTTAREMSISTCIWNLICARACGKWIFPIGHQGYGNRDHTLYGLFFVQ